MKIALLCPTRKRPENMERVVKSAYETAKHPENVSFYFYIDSDDLESIYKVHELKQQYHNIYTVPGERIVLSQMWNKCYEVSKEDNEVFMHLGDDIIFRSADWDEKVVGVFNNYPDRIVLVHGDDLFWKAQFGTHCFIHKNWAETVGYFVPPYFSSDFNDTWLNDVANDLNRRVYLEDVVTEHMHYVFGKAEKDINTIEREERGARDNVKDMYDAKKPERDADVAKLREFIQAYGKNNN